MRVTKLFTSEPGCKVVEVLRCMGEIGEVGSVHNSLILRAVDGKMIMAEFYPATNRWLVFC